MGDLSPTRAETGVIHAMIPRAIKSQIADSGDAAPLDPKLVPTIRKHVVAMIAGDPHARQALESMLAEHHLTVDIIGAATFGTRSGHRFTSTEWWRQLVTLDLGVVMAALVEAGLGSSYTSEWSCEERKTAEIRFSAKLSWETCGPYRRESGLGARGQTKSWSGTDCLRRSLARDLNEHSEVRAFPRDGRRNSPAPERRGNGNPHMLLIVLTQESLTQYN
jgi:hypothetical protein